MQSGDNDKIKGGEIFLIQSKYVHGEHTSTVINSRIMKISGLHTPLPKEIRWRKQQHI